MQFKPWFIGRWRAVLSALGSACAGPAWSVRVSFRVSAWCGRLLPAVLASATAVASEPPAAGVAAEPVSMGRSELALLDAINQYRGTQGRPPWQADAGLARVARQHSQAMATLGRLSHDGFQRRAAGTGSDLCVENLLRGSVAPARAVQLWMQSPAHHDNLLEPGARYAGVGMVGRFVTLLACTTPPVPLAVQENAPSAPGRP